MLLLLCALSVITKTLAMRILVNMSAPSNEFQRLMLTSRQDMFQLKNFQMLLKFAPNKMFTPAKFTLDSHDFQLLRLGVIGVVIYLLLLEHLSMVLGNMRRYEMTKKPPLVEE